MVFLDVTGVLRMNLNCLNRNPEFCHYQSAWTARFGFTQMRRAGLLPSLRQLITSAVAATECKCFCSKWYLVVPIGCRLSAPGVPLPAVPEWSCIAVPFDSKLVRTGGGRDVAHASATREDKPS